MVSSAVFRVRSARRRLANGPAGARATPMTYQVSRDGRQFGDACVAAPPHLSVRMHRYSTSPNRARHLSSELTQHCRST